MTLSWNDTRIMSIRDQRSEIRDQRSEIRDQRSEIRDQRYMCVFKYVRRFLLFLRPAFFSFFLSQALSAEPAPFLIAQNDQGQSTSQTLTDADRDAYYQVKRELKKARDYLKLGRIRAAIKHLYQISRTYRSILKKSRKMAYYWYKFMGVARERNKQDDKAVEFYKKAIKINKKDLYSMLKVSRISLLKLKNKKQAGRISETRYSSEA